MKSFACVLLAVAIAACSGHVLDVGSNDGGLGEAGNLDAQASLLAPSWLVGTWQGAIDGFEFPSGSNALTLTVVAGPDQTLSAHLLLGDLPLWPPPTDPDTTYPPGFGEGPLSAVESRVYYSEGFEYTAVPFAFDGIELDFGIETLEVWKQWCELQATTLVPEGPDGGLYGCLYMGPFAWDPDSGTCSGLVAADASVTALDCGRVSLCVHDGSVFGVPDGAWGVCRCTATSCTSDALYATDVPGSGQPDVTFSLNSSGSDGLTGITSGTFGEHAVHLTRAEGP
jgi:hypothetical protein